MDRRTTVKWVLAAGAAWPLLETGSEPAAAAPAARGYGTDPNLVAAYSPGELWPLTLTPEQRRLAGILADIIIPADAHSPSASDVGVVAFIDEWLSAPYPAQQRDRTRVLTGLAWLDAEALRRFGQEFSRLDAPQQHAICEDICEESRAAPALREGALFFARFRDLTAGGFYCTAAGRKDLDFIGNVPLARFAGPPPELLKSLGLE